MIRTLTVALILASLTACSRYDSRFSGGPEPRQTPYQSGPIPIGSWGIGPIRAATYFESPVIGDLFPNASVKDVTLRIAKDDTLDGITVTKDGVQLLELDDGLSSAPNGDDPLIGAVRAVGGPVVGPTGERLGMSWKASKFDLSQCEIGVDRDRNTVICARPGVGSVTYYFAVPGWDSEEVPPDSMMRKGAYLKAIVWTPPPVPGAIPDPPDSSDSSSR